MLDKLTDPAHAFHGGRFFEAVGPDFKNLTQAETVVSADVLDAWFDPSPRVLEKLREHLPLLLRTSPPAHGEGLIQTISEARGIPRANLCIGGGSSHLIFTSLPLFSSERGRVLILDPMYGEYAHVLENVLRREVCRYYLRDEDHFRINVEALVEQVRREDPELVVIVNPNSPTGQHWPRTELLEFLHRIPHTLCLVDETYIDYVPGTQSVESEVTRRSNLVVLKSMSKVYALSGLRVAYLAASAAIINALVRLIPPWSVSLPAQVAAVEAVADNEYYQSRYRMTHLLRAQAVGAARRLEGIKVFDSCANFYLIKTEGESAAGIQEGLEGQGIFVRHCDSMSAQFHDNFLRIAVKREDQNNRIIAALKAALTNRAGAFSGAPTHQAS